MTGRRRSKAERMADHAWNVKVAQRTPNVWLKYMPPMTQGGDTNKELRELGVQVRSVQGRTEIKFVDEQLDLTPVEVAPVPVMAAAELDAYDVLKAELIAAGLNENCLTCRFQRGWECRRHAAVAAENGFANWAKVEPDDWCGEYEEREEGCRDS